MPFNIKIPILRDNLHGAADIFVKIRELDPVKDICIGV